ncbi:MAG: tetratricopeptide repeat protein [Gammaproteobacteria bacterium]|nr:tetratricopeptide repeat protein [Pseudomonadales bacterium]
MPSIPAPDPGVEQYFAGLEYLRAGDPASALAPLDRAIALMPADAEVALARAVTLTLLANFNEAKSELVKLGQSSRHALVWNYVHSAMSGDFTGLPSVPANMVRSYEEVGCVAPGRSVPGNVLQGDRSFPTAYATFLIYDFASPWGEWRCGQTTSAPDVSQAAAWFARVALVQPRLQPFHAGRSMVYLQAGDFAAALAYAEFAALAQPGNGDVTTLTGLVRLQAGDWEEARRLFTQAITQGTGDVRAWLGRAETALAVGETQRGKADLERAEARDEDLTEAWEDRLNTLRSANARPDSNALQEAWRTLQAAAYERPDAELERHAATLINLSHPQRVRYDEHYTATLDTLLTAAQKTDDAEDWTALAQYVANESDLRSESVEPRRPAVNWRWQGSQRAELETALGYTDRAIARDRTHVPAIMSRAEILAKLGRDNEAEAAAASALEIDPDDRQALTLYAMYRGRRSNNLAAQAAALRADSCTSTTTTENRHDGVWEVTRRTCVRPSAADLARANQLDAQAAALRQESRVVMNRALELNRGTYEGFLVAAEIALWSLDYNGAADAFRAAVRLDPADMRAREALVQVLPRLGAHEEAAAHAVAINAPLQTTAAPMLSLARRAMQAGQWAQALPWLEQAALLDPEDARVFAYRGVIQEQSGQTDAALAEYRAALALEKVRLQRSWSGVLPAPAVDHALYIGLAVRVARMHSAAQNTDAALALLAEITALPDRMAADWRAQPFHVAHMPPFTEEPANGASWIALALLESGRLHIVAGRRDAALDAFARAVALGPPKDRPNIGTAQGDSNFAADAGEPAGDALMELIQMAMEDGDAEQAMRLAEQTGYMKMSADSRAKLNNLAQQMAKAQQLAERRTQQQELAADPRVVQEQQAFFREVEASRARAARGDRQPGIAASLQLPAELVGRWQAAVGEEYRNIGENGVYEFAADGRFVFTPDRAGQERSGLWGAIGRGTSAILLLGADGTQETIYLESERADHYTLTTELALRYDLRKLAR